MKTSLIRLVIIALALSFCSCNSPDYTSLSCNEKNFDGNCFPKPDSTKVATPDPHLDNVNVFVETSGSMAGYMPAKDSATEFQQIIPEVVSSLNTSYPNKVHFYSIYNSSEPFDNLSIDQSREKILHGKFDWSGSTYLPLMLDTVMSKYLKANAVNIFISDCIYSPEKKDNKTTALATTDIRDETVPFSKSYSTLLVYLSSRFDGKHSITRKSPYYMIIQGQPENLALIKTSVLTSFDRYRQQHQEIDFEHHLKNPAYSVLPYTDKSSNFSAEPAKTFNGAYVKLDKVDLTTAKELSFWLGIDLKKLPVFARNAEYIKSNISVSLDQGAAEVIDVRDTPPDNLREDDRPLASRYTHFIKVKVTDFSGDVGALAFSLKYIRPQWVKLLNEPDPANENIREKTFGLDRMVTGFEEAYGQDKNYYFFNHITLSLIKKS